LPVEEAAIGEAEQIIPVGHRREPATPEIEFGIQVHRYLELHTAGWADEAIQLDIGLDGAAFAAVREKAEVILNAPEARRFFAAGQGLNELEYVAADGQLRRIDRLVELDDEVWVLDYKTGGADDAYVEQLAEYRAAAAAFHPGKRIRAALLYADGKVQEVE
jgi:ATP-dependent helicase/nuclease subunit A